VSFEVAVLAYTIAIFATFAPVPGGIGVVELIVPAMLHHFGVAKSTGLAAVLVWRGVSMFLPALAGLIAYTALRLSRPKRSVAEVVESVLDGPVFDDDSGPEAAVVV
jgi:uncharacterized protein (TIRG00374 family)